MTPQTDVLIEAPVELARALGQTLAAEGYAVRTPVDPGRLPEEITASQPSLLLLALDGDAGSQLYSALRYLPELQHLPFLLLVRGETLGQVELRSSLDDFLVLPPGEAELAVRVSAAIRRGHRAQPEAGLRIGELVVDVQSFEVTVRGTPVDLTYKEFELLKHLATSPGRVFTREQLLREIWGYDYFGGTRTVDVHIRRIRQKLGDQESLIQTVRNVGYRFARETAA